MELCHTGEVVCEAGAFFVARKDNKLRLIFDTRASNFYFEDMPFTQLGSPEALSEMVLEPGGALHIYDGDVEVCFYRYELEPPLRRFFGLPPCQDKFLPPRLRAAAAAAGIDSPRFRVRVVPMGWSWAVHLIQAAHMEVLAGAT